MSRADAARRRAARRVLHDGAASPHDEAALQLIASYGFGGRKTLSSTYRLKEGLIGQCAFEKKRILVTTCPRTSSTSRAAWARRRPATSSCCRCCSRASSRRSSSWPRSRRSAANHLAFLDQLMEKRRRRPQHDLVQHADGGAAPGAEAVQRGARGPGRRAEREGEAARGEEQRGRAGQPQPRGEGGAAPAHLQVQVRVPRQHVATSCARRSTACSSCRRCSPRTGTGTSPPEQVEVREHRLHLRQRAPRAHQRDPGPLQGRGRQDADRAARRVRSTRCASTWSRPSATWPSRRGSPSRCGSRPGAAGADLHRRGPAPADPEEPALERVQVHRRRAASR